MTPSVRSMLSRTPIATPSSPQWAMLLPNIASRCQTTKQPRRAVSRATPMPARAARSRKSSIMAVVRAAAGALHRAGKVVLVIVLMAVDAHGAPGFPPEHAHIFGMRVDCLRHALAADMPVE